MTQCMAFLLILRVVTNVSILRSSLLFFIHMIRWHLTNSVSFGPHRRHIQRDIATTYRIATVHIDYTCLCIVSIGDENLQRKIILNRTYADTLITITPNANNNVP